MKFNSKDSFKSLDNISSSGKEYKIFNLKSKFNNNFLSRNFSLDKKKDLHEIKKIFSKFSKINKRINTNNLYKLSSRKVI